MEWGRLELTKAWYCTDRYSSDKYADGSLKIQPGWVVTGLLDSCNDLYMIPETYDGLPIIGILHIAYERLKEYKDDNACHKVGDDKIDLPVTIHFSYNKMLFVFAPRLYSNRYHVLPTYYVNDSNNNAADMYGAAYFSYAHSGEVINPVTQIMKVKNVPYYWGYTHISRCANTWTWYEKGARGDKKVSQDVIITLRQASQKTFETCYIPSGDKTLLESLPDDWRKIWRTSWKALNVGAYYSLGRNSNHSLAENKAYFDSHNGVLGFVWQPAQKDILLAFNLLKGTAEVVRITFA